MYYCISFTHKNTDIALREKLSFSNEAKKSEFLKIISTHENIEECLV
ncbi:glutamyl-tRNA reductase, partial [Campylobacter coli]